MSSGRSNWRWRYLRLLARKRRGSANNNPRVPGRSHSGTVGHHRHLFSGVSPSSPIAFSRMTIRASSDARSRVISPSSIIAVRARASAWLSALDAEPAYLFPATAVMSGMASVPKSTFSGLSAGQLRRPDSIPARKSGTFARRSPRTPSACLAGRALLERTATHRE